MYYNNNNNNNNNCNLEFNATMELENNAASSIVFSFFFQVNYLSLFAIVSHFELYNNMPVLCGCMVKIYSRCSFKNCYI
jgi:hypothetical protein